MNKFEMCTDDELAKLCTCEVRGGGGGVEEGVYRNS